MVLLLLCLLALCGLGINSGAEGLQDSVHGSSLCGSMAEAAAAWSCVLHAAAVESLLVSLYNTVQQT
jgi:hypothetical protein